MNIQHYEKVEILPGGRFPKYEGCFGWVMGISRKGDRAQGYSVTILDLDRSVWLYPHELRGTGEFADRSMFYSGETVRIRVHNVGYLVEDEDS
jgi:hypothetical protein